MLGNSHARILGGHARLPAHLPSLIESDSIDPKTLQAIAPLGGAVEELDRVLAALALERVAIKLPAIFKLESFYELMKDLVRGGTETWQQICNVEF